MFLRANDAFHVFHFFTHFSSLNLLAANSLLVLTLRHTRFYDWLLCIGQSCMTTAHPFLSWQFTCPNRVESQGLLGWEWIDGYKQKSKHESPWPNTKINVDLFYQKVMQGHHAKESQSGGNDQWQINELQDAYEIGKRVQCSAELHQCDNVQMCKREKATLYEQSSVKESIMKCTLLGWVIQHCSFSSWKDILCLSERLLFCITSQPIHQHLKCCTHVACLGLIRMTFDAC